MVKQIKEQAEILCQHVQSGDIDLEFVALHALHLSQLADFLRADKIASEILKGQKEFMLMVGA